MIYKKFFHSICLTVSCCVTVIMATVFPMSCKMTEHGIDVTNTDTEVPKIENFAMQDSSNLVISCSEKIKLEELLIENLQDNQITSVSNVTYNEENKEATITLETETTVGDEYTISGKVVDEASNSLLFSLPFVGYNDNQAYLILSEIRTKHSTSNNTLKKSEYIEFYVLKSGNTAGLEIITGSDGVDKKYIFPAIEVQQGEYITVHYRVLSEGACIDELTDDLTLSTAESSSNKARDLWINNVETRISDSDVIVLKDSIKNTIMDSILYSMSNKKDWYTNEQKSLASDCYENGNWSGGCGVNEAACSDNITAIRTLSRLNIKDIVSTLSVNESIENEIILANKNDWAVVKLGTPGEENSLEKYVK